MRVSPTLIWVSDLIAVYRFSAASSEVAPAATPAAFTKGTPIENVQARIDALVNRPVRGSVAEQTQEGEQGTAKDPVQGLVDKYLSHLPVEVQAELLDATMSSIKNDIYEKYAPTHDFITALNQLPSQKGTYTFFHFLHLCSPSPLFIYHFFSLPLTSRNP